MPSFFFKKPYSSEFHWWYPLIEGGHWPKRLGLCCRRSSRQGWGMPWLLCIINDSSQMIQLCIYHTGTNNDITIQLTTNQHCDIGLYTRRCWFDTRFFKWVSKYKRPPRQLARHRQNLCVSPRFFFIKINSENHHVTIQNACK